MTGPLLQLENAAFGYSGHPVVEKISLEMGAGDFTVLTGTNGSGKTTLLRGVLGLTPYRSGRISWNIPLSEMGYVPQESGIDPSVPASCLDVVLTAFPFGNSLHEKAALSALASLNLDDKAYSRFGSLSGGQKRRVLLARALADNPAMLLLDEPMANVDAETEVALASLLKDLCLNLGIAVLATAHDLSWAPPTARRLLVEKGRLHG